MAGGEGGGVAHDVGGRAGGEADDGGAGEIEIYKIVRAQVELGESAARGKVIEHEMPNSQSKLKIGYINLPSFYLDMEGARTHKPDYRSTTKDLRKILTKFNYEKVDAVVLDLSRNGGGSLPESVSATGLFIDRGSVVQVKSPDGNIESLDDDEKGAVWNGPLVVKVSQMSASASEIFAGAIQDYGRGIIVGDPKTHGKGTVQTLLDLDQHIPNQAPNTQYGALKLTIQQFYLPDGRSTQLEGVSADVVLPSITANLDISESDLDYALPVDKVPARPHKKYPMVDSAMKIMLQQAANQRITKNPEFEKLLSKIDAYVKQKDDKTISLKESDFLARRKELNTEKEEDEQLEAKAERNKVYNPGFYNQEIINITRDYIDALKLSNKLSAR